MAYSDSDISPSIMLFRYTQDEAYTLASPDTSGANHTIVIGVTTDNDQPNGARCEVDYFVYVFLHNPEIQGLIQGLVLQIPSAFILLE